MPNRVAAYTVNIAGSLAGIAAFALASYLRTPPLVWFGRRRWRSASTSCRDRRCCGCWRRSACSRCWRSRPTRSRRSQTDLVAVLQDHLPPAATRPSTPTTSATSRWSTSPTAGAAYALPHLLNRDAGGAPFDGRADHRRRIGQRRRGGTAAWRRRISTPSRSIRRSTSSAAGITRTIPTTTRG